MARAWARGMLLDLEHAASTFASLGEPRAPQPHQKADLGVIVAAMIVAPHWVGLAGETPSLNTSLALLSPPRVLLALSDPFSLSVRSGKQHLPGRV